MALLQVVRVLRYGGPSRDPPIPVPPDADQRLMDISEGQQVELLASAAIPCVVSFAPGQERRVYFSAAGASISRLPPGGGTTGDLSRTNSSSSSAVAAGAPARGGKAAGGSGDGTPAAVGGGAGAGGQTDEVQMVLLHSSPAVVLADPAPTRLNAGA